MMDGWKEYRLDEACSKVTDGTHDTPKSVKKGIPLIKGKDISTGYIDFENCEKITVAEYEKIIKRSHPENGDILYTNIGNSIGDCVYINTDRKFGIKNVALFKPNSSISNKKFLFYIVLSEKFTGEILNKISGAAQPFASLNLLRSHKINLPPLPTQCRIATILSAYDDLIENNLKRIKLLEEIAQKTYEEWFVRMKFPGNENTSIDVESGLPVGWKRERLKNTDIKLIDGDRGVNYPKQNDFYEKEYCLFLNTGNVTSNGFDFTNCKFITKEKDSVLRKGKIKYSDIILTTRGTIGNVVFYKKGIPFTNVRINSGMLIIRCNKEILSNYLHQTFISKGLQNQMQVFSYGAAQPQLPVGTLNNIQILIPKMQIQKDFSEIIEKIIKVANMLRNQNQHLNEARDILLPRLMTGMITIDN